MAWLWSGPSPEQDPSNWQTINYKYDLYGRRSEKKVDGFSTRYVYDGPHVIAEYDGNNNLLRKYIYGPCIDEPVCMIEVADSNAVYYYHYDALGSVVALSDSSGDTVQTYQYSIYGQVAVEDINHPNPYMFAGRRFDIEIGLYYNRARYYNPYTGRFLQADPIGYGDGMNLYAYCGNNPVGLSDPSGMASGFGFSKWINPNPGCNIEWPYEEALKFSWTNDDGMSDYRLFSSIDGWITWAEGGGWLDVDNEGNDIYLFPEGWEEGQSGWAVTADAKTDRNWWFWRIKALMIMSNDFTATVEWIEHKMNFGFVLNLYRSKHGSTYCEGSTIAANLYWGYEDSSMYDGSRNWHNTHPLANLAHEFAHAAAYASRGFNGDYEISAMQHENNIRAHLFSYGQDIWPRPGYNGYVADLEGANAAEAWSNYDPAKLIPPDGFP